MILLQSKSIYYDDVNLIDQYSSINHRDSIYFNASRIWVSPMTSIVGVDFIKAYAELPPELQPTLCIPRGKNQAEMLELVVEYGLINVCVACGINDWYDILKKIYEYKLASPMILLDVAKGNCEIVCKTLNLIKDSTDMKIITGNVQTSYGASVLYNNGANGVRVGIASGSACTTMNATGINRGQITEIDEIADDCLNKNLWIIADGGILEPGDCMKAFGAGATDVMMGHYFSGAIEAECQVKKTNFYGMASSYGKEDVGNSNRYIEGRSIGPRQKNTLENLMKNMVEGIQSGLSYQGCESIDEYIGNGVFELKFR